MLNSIKFDEVQIGNNFRGHLPYYSVRFMSFYLYYYLKSFIFDFYVLDYAFAGNMHVLGSFGWGSEV